MRNSAPRVWFLVLLVIALCGTACKKRTRGTEVAEGVTILPVPETRNETGWPVYEVKNEGFSVSLPPDWRQFDMNPATFEKTMGDVMKNNPAMKDLYPNLLQQMKSGVKFFGLDEKTMRTGFATNANVMVVPVAPQMTAAQVFDATVADFERLPGLHKPIGRERVRTAAGDAERLRFTIDMRGPTGNNRLVIITYVFVSNGKMYSVTAGALADQEEQYRPTFDKIGQSFRLIK